MKDPLQLALEAGRPVKEHRDGTHTVRVNESTAAYLDGKRWEFDEKAWLLCCCRSFQFPHHPNAHQHLRFGDLDWRTWEQRRNQWVEDGYA